MKRIPHRGGTAGVPAPLNMYQQLRVGRAPAAPSPTVLGELGGGELRGDEERLFGAALEDEAGGDVGAAVVVLFAAGQAQVQGMVVKCAVLITLRAEAENTEYFLNSATCASQVPGDFWLISVLCPETPQQG